MGRIAYIKNLQFRIINSYKGIPVGWINSVESSWQINVLWDYGILRNVDINDLQSIIACCSIGVII